MTTLHLEVTVNDVAAFKSGFADHTEIRRQAGVHTERVRHPIGDDSHLIVDLDFDSVEQAEGFLGILKENIWKDNPALAGTPDYSILEPLAHLSDRSMKTWPPDAAARSVGSLMCSSG